MLKPKLRGRKYPRRKGWKEGIDLSVCVACGASVTRWDERKERFFPNAACDHIVPERAVRLFSKGSDPHVSENLAGMCASCHAKKLAIERFLYAGNLLSYFQGMLGLGFSKDRVNSALRATGFPAMP